MSWLGLKNSTLEFDRRHNKSPPPQRKRKKEMFPHQCMYFTCLKRHCFILNRDVDIQFPIVPNPLKMDEKKQKQVNDELMREQRALEEDVKKFRKLEDIYKSMMDRYEIFPSP